jgi:predicted aminopeptidase
LYAEPLPPDAMRTRKAQEFARLRSDYARLRDTQWHGDKSYDAWFAGDLNNAKLLPFGLYRRWTAAFAALFAQCGGDWERFFAAVEKLAHEDAATRTAHLEAIASAGQKP